MRACCHEIRRIDFPQPGATLPYSIDCAPRNCASDSTSVADGGGGVGRRVWLGVDVIDLEGLGFALEVRIDAPDQLVAVQDGQDVVAILPLIRRDVDFDAEEEVE